MRKYSSYKYCRNFNSILFAIFDLNFDDHLLRILKSTLKILSDVFQNK